MDLINISVEQKEVNRRLIPPAADGIPHSIAAAEMPALHWYRIFSLGFGQEREKDGANAEAERRRADEAAALFASCRCPFAILCERTGGEETVYAIGCTEKQLVPTLLKSVFGTVRCEEYTPQFPGESGLYAHSYEAVRTNADELGRRDAQAAVHMSGWADTAAKALTLYPGMIRLDFQPADAAECEKCIAAARNLSDSAAAWLESSIQAGDTVSVESQDNIFGTIQKNISGETKYNKSSNASVSWKGISARLSEQKKEADYWIQLFTQAKKQGWTVEMRVCAGQGVGELPAAEKAGRETALSVPLAAMLARAGYTCRWDFFGPFGERDRQRSALLLPASSAAEFVSLPTESFFGFERIRNGYYAVNLPHSDKSVPFAELMQYGEKTGAGLRLPEKEMNRHTFICGMTGSGKTNSVHHLLSALGDFPYLVIEPVKSEYHSLPGVKTYTMTAGSSRALCLNPFWFPKGSSLQYHIDYLKQIISSAFDLYAAMPNILEQCLVLVYQHCGWDFIQNENRYAAELPESMLYPTFRDLCREVDTYIENAKFGEELKGNYRGALLSRLQSFTSGPKGMLLNTSEHLPCEELSEGKVVISLDALADDADKSIVMGIILAQYYEYRKLQCADSTKKELQHIVVLEEAHHLFAGDAGSSSASAEGGSGQNAAMALVKTLNNMLAEIRAYGEGFIIVDQSPSALHPSVLKNTGVKIAHRIDYGQDIEAMREALLLERDDRELAALCPGQALVHYGGMRTSAKVQVPPCRTKEESVISAREEITGSSVACTLLEDTALSDHIRSSIVERVVHHLLYDALENVREFHTLLCRAVKTAMIRYGHAELADTVTGGPLLADYISALLPGVLETPFPHQYCTCRMICMYAGRFLTLAAETNGELSRAEITAFENYRTHRIEPRLCAFFDCSDVGEYRRACALIGCSMDLNLICNLTADLCKLPAEPGQLEETIRRLLTEYYFLCMPRNSELLIARTAGLWRCSRRKESVC